MHAIESMTTEFRMRADDIGQLSRRDRLIGHHEPDRGGESDQRQDGIEQ